MSLARPRFSRAAVLAGLDAPRSTSELAHRLGLSTPSVSQHLAVLRDAGLVHANRVGNFLFSGFSARSRRWFFALFSVKTS